LPVLYPVPASSRRWECGTSAVHHRIGVTNVMGLKEKIR
jgi:hypothetical protein